MESESTGQLSRKIVRHGCRFLRLCAMKIPLQVDPRDNGNRTSSKGSTYSTAE